MALVVESGGGRRAAFSRVKVRIADLGRDGQEIYFTVGFQNAPLARNDGFAHSTVLPALRPVTPLFAPFYLF